MCTVVSVGILLVSCINGIRSNTHMIRSIIGHPISETVFVAGAYANYDMNAPVLCILRKLSYKQDGYFFLAKSLPDYP
jgi:signal transduction histidine kinase